MARTNYDKTKLNNDLLYTNINDDGDIKQKILNKLIQKIVNSNRSDNLDIKYSGKKNKKLNVLISGKRLNKKIIQKEMNNKNNYSNLHNSNDSIFNINNKSLDTSSSQILEDNNSKEIKTHQKIIHLKKDLNKYKLPEIKKNNIINNYYLKNFIYKYYSKNFQHFFNKINNINRKIDDNSSSSIIIEKEENLNNKKDKLPIIPNINLINRNKENIKDLDAHTLFKKDYDRSKD